MDTERLIRTLAENVEPVRPLASPWVRAAWWTCAAGIYLVLLMVVVPPRVDPAARLQDIGFLAEQGAAFLTGVTAAFAALASSVPGYRRKVVWLPITFASVWITLVGVAALQTVQSVSPPLQADWRCVPATLIGAAMPAAAIAFMLRRGVPLTPRMTAALGALAATGVGNIGICFFHPHGSSLAVLVWHCGTVLVVAALAAMVGEQFLRWPVGRGALVAR
jgi:hypothetical protein